MHGPFEGLPSNAPEQVAEIVTICKANDCVQPKIYQVYVVSESITLGMATELLRCCRKVGTRAVDLESSGRWIVRGKSDV